MTRVEHHQRCLMMLGLWLPSQLVLLAMSLRSVDAIQLGTSSLVHHRTAGLRLAELEAATGIDFCISSRWGFSCFAPKRNRALLDLSGGRLGSQVQMVTRLGARACLVCGGAWVCRECLRDLKFAYREMRAGAGPAEVREDVFMRPLPSSLG